MILYIHIPFCDSKCGYCTFFSYTDKSHLKQAYIDALILDLDSTLQTHLHTAKTLESIYIGGGTPNTLDSSVYIRIFETIFRHSALPQEITIEANPNLLTRQWCDALVDLGANRISIGVQSFRDDKLAFLERNHTYKDIALALQCAKNFQHISIDLIYDTPLDSIQSLKQEIAQAAALPINHISAYSLTLEKGSSLYKQYHNKLDSSHYGDIIKQELASYGFNQYEVSNYERGHKSLHNLAYWQAKQYLGCGAAAVGRIGDIRYYGANNIERYITNPLQKTQESLTKENLEFEKLFLGLRSEVGVTLQNLDSSKVQILLEEKKCSIQNGMLKALDFFLADEIALWLSS